MIIILAFGTKGDVLPLLAIANALLEHKTVKFVTHNAHQDWIQPSEERGLTVHYITALPARSWDGSSTPNNNKTLTTCIQQECVAACLPPPTPPTTAILFNLFALEGLHIAEALQCPAIALSPCLVPYSMPLDYDTKLYQQTAKASPTTTTKPVVSLQTWLETHNLESVFRHWMWPAYSIDRWSTWRQESLKLTPTHTTTTTANNWLQTKESILLLYGLSEVLIPRAGYWPSSVHLTGYWTLPLECFPVHEQTLPINFQQYIDTIEKQRQQLALASERVLVEKLIAVDFGSMGKLGLLPDADRLVDVLGGVFERCSVKVCLVVLAHGWQPLIDAIAKYKTMMAKIAISGNGNDECIICIEGSIAHQVLLPHCTSLLCHGGSGTVAAGLQCGLPIIVFPMQFDQFSTAEMLEYNGLGVSFRWSGDVNIDTGKLGQCVERVENDKGMREMCREMGKQLKQEDGVKLAVERVGKALNISSPHL